MSSNLLPFVDVLRTFIDGWFMVDEEITGPLFASEEFYDTELDIMVDYGDAEMRDALEQHYNNWMSDGDFVWLQAHGFNTIRFGVSSFVEPIRCPHVDDLCF